MFLYEDAWLYLSPFVLMREVKNLPGLVGPCLSPSIASKLLKTWRRIADFEEKVVDREKEKTLYIIKKQNFDLAK